MKNIVLYVLVIVLAASFSFAKINVNTAKKEELITLKGLGDKRADEIIKSRAKKPFKSIEELLEIKGIGEKFIENNKKEICFGKDC